MRLTYNPEFERSCITFIAKMKGAYIVGIATNN